MDGWSKEASYAVIFFYLLWMDPFSNTLNTKSYGAKKFRALTGKGDCLLKKGFPVVSF